MIDEAWQATERSRAQGWSVGAVTRHLRTLPGPPSPKPTVRLIYLELGPQYARMRGGTSPRGACADGRRWSSRPKSGVADVVDFVEDERRRIGENATRRTVPATAGRWCERPGARLAHVDRPSWRSARLERGRLRATPPVSPALAPAEDGEGLAGLDGSC